MCGEALVFRTRTGKQWMDISCGKIVINRQHLSSTGADSNYRALKLCVTHFVGFYLFLLPLFPQLLLLFPQLCIRS